MPSRDSDSRPRLESAFESSSSHVLGSEQQALFPFVASDDAKDSLRKLWISKGKEENDETLLTGLHF